MRILGPVRNIARIRDIPTGEVIELAYRMPTATEMAEYAAKRYERTDGEISNRIVEMSIEYGEKILVGIEEGAFGLPSGEPISSDPDSPDFHEKWREILKQYAPDVVSALGLHVFEGGAIAPGPKRVPEKSGGDNGTANPPRQTN